MSDTATAICAPSIAPATPRQRLLRWIELIAIFYLPPAIYALGVFRPPIILALLVMGALALTVLLRDPSFDRRQLWRFAGLHHEFRHVVLLFAIGIVVFIGLLAVFDPGKLFLLPRQRPGLWLLILVGYPLLSVYPQELLFRAYFFHRFACLFRPAWAMIIVNAAIFAWAHVLFQHWIPILATLVGGLIFAWRYDRRRSLAVVCVEHSLYGQLIFTIGLGQYFFHGSMHAMQKLMGG